MGNTGPSLTGEIPDSYFMYLAIFILAMPLVIIVVTVIVQDIIKKWCTEPRPIQGPASSCSLPTAGTLNFIPVFKYKKQLDAEEGECAVCLSAFREGEELKRLPKCKHSFHAPCIDMWLNSHMDCPLCRSPVDLPPDSVLRPHSPEGLIRGPDLV